MQYRDLKKNKLESQPQGHQAAVSILLCAAVVVRRPPSPGCQDPMMVPYWTEGWMGYLALYWCRDLCRIDPAEEHNRIHKCMHTEYEWFMLHPLFS